MTILRNINNLSGRSRDKNTYWLAVTCTANAKHEMQKVGRSNERLEEQGKHNRKPKTRMKDTRKGDSKHAILTYFNCITN